MCRLIEIENLNLGIYAKGLNCKETKEYLNNISRDFILIKNKIKNKKLNTCIKNPVTNDFLIFI